MGDPDVARLVLCQLAGQGIELSIDDFGTGYSSFAYLRRLPIGELKIDKSIVLALAREAADQTIVRTIVDLGHNLGLKVTAEGVEDRTTYDLLANYGCDLGQGYFMGRPLTLSKFEAFAQTSTYAADRRA
jgi:EAL domain-containing protein (putative c-di-GMP-specific phosphodiesterase class I)